MEQDGAWVPLQDGSQDSARVEAELGADRYR